MPIAVTAADLPLRPAPSGFPPDLLAKLQGRDKQVLGDLFGLTRFGVNLTRLHPGGASSMRHAHSVQDEFVFVLEGEAVLITDAGETVLRAGMCAGFPHGTGDAHRLVNRSAADVVFLEMGDRGGGDVVTYPEDDLHAVMQTDGHYRYTRKDGTPL